MKGQNPTPYHRKGGKTIGFKYEVTGSEQEIAQFKAVQGENFREDTVTGKPLYFARNGYEGKVVELEIAKSSEGVDQVYPKTSRLQTLKKLIESTTDEFDKEILKDEYRALYSANTREALALVDALNKSTANAETAAPGSEL